MSIVQPVDTPFPTALTPETGKDDPPLEVLVLRNNSIGEEGATAIAQVLTCNKTLKKVDLYWNNIGNKGLVALCDVLRPNLPKDYVLVNCIEDVLRMIYRAKTCQWYCMPDECLRGQDIRYNGYDPDDPTVEWQVYCMPSAGLGVPCVTISLLELLLSHTL